MPTDAPAIQNPAGAVHGGAIATLADSAGGIACWMYGKKVVTSSLNMHYCNPTQQSKKLIATAKEIKSGRRLMVYEIMIRDDRNTLIAMATGTYVPLELPVVIPEKG